MPTTIAQAADRLIQAADTRVPCDPVRDLIGRDDQAAAYAVQRLVTEERIRRGARRCGRKIGLTSAAVQQQLGVDQPDSGVLFADMVHRDGALVPPGAVLQPRVEAEVAFVLGADLDDGPLDAGQVRAATAYVVAALEICGSRIQDWDISFADTVADNASSGAVVLGATPVGLAEVEPAEVAMLMTVDGAEVSTGTGRACLGDPVLAVAWLARVSREVGDPLRAGDLVMSGALGPMHPLAPGARVHAALTGLGTVTTTFGERNER
ncbi:MAG: fumarylacetoacetate hydrolase family protein [Nocardioidaceae bacterium]|nr:fumarylacetoacetate hydrolase family protein [Nocardioidaceae bacterium]